jgi:hypothetical protein
MTPLARQPEDQPSARPARPADPVRACSCPESDGQIRHQRSTCTDPVVAQLDWFVTEERDRKRPGCPAWCTDHVDYLEGMGPVNKHRTIRRINGPTGRSISVTLIQTFGTKYLPNLYVSGVRVNEDHISGMRWLMSDLGHEDIAAAIDELAALA